MPSGDQLMLDTHVLLWWKADPTQLSSTASRALEAATQLLLSPISCWEIGMLVAKQRVALDRPTRIWVNDVLAAERLALADLTASVAVAAAELSDFHGDPADRIIVATARELRVPLLTKDRLIHAYADKASAPTVIW